jgi:acylphosphatase
MPDGSVEVLACGEPEALDRLADWLQHGPPMASVSRVESSSVKETDCPDSFFTS